MANKDFKVKNGIDIQSPLPVSMGGTGQTTTGNTLNALLPSQAGNSSKVLSTDGTNTTWVAQAVAYQRGGTESRPASPTAGDLYYNTDTNIFEQYTSSGWFALAAAPGSPTGVTATNQGSGRAFNNGQASVAFTASTSGGAPATFTITPSPTTSPATFTGSVSPITVTGLASSTQYTYTATATSPYGTSAASSASTGVTATTVPQAPTINSVVAGNQQVEITFTAGGTGGAAITQYSITSSPATTTQTTSSSPYTFTGLTNDIEYTFTITATNSNGTSTGTTSSSVIPSEADPGATIPLFATTVGSSGSSTITFNNIPQTYTHLQLRIIAKTTETTYTGEDNFNMYLNGDTTQTNYRNHWVRSVATSATASSLQGSGYQAYTGTIATSGAGQQLMYSPAIIDILDYSNTSKYTTIRTINGDSVNSTNGGIVGLYSSVWFNTAGINSITFTVPGGSNYAEHSSFALYGIKGE